MSRPLNKYEKAICKKLADRRREVGLSQRAVADDLGYTTPQLVSNWERYLIMPPFEKMRKLSKMYKMPTLQKDYIDCKVATLKIQWGRLEA